MDTSFRAMKKVVVSHSSIIPF